MQLIKQFKFFKKSLITIIKTDHDCINYDLIRKNSKFIIDTRGRFKYGKKNLAC